MNPLDSAALIYLSVMSAGFVVAVIVEVFRAFLVRRP